MRQLPSNQRITRASATFVRKFELVTIGWPFSLYMPPPALPAVLPEIVVFVIKGEEFSALATPPPKSAELLEIVVLMIDGEESKTL